MKNMHLSNWFFDYCRDMFTINKRNEVEQLHIMFLFVDHYELAGKTPRLTEWVEKYPKLAGKHFDSDGMYPRHTWFYALDLLRVDELAQLKKLVDCGFGEVELHWHHSHDTPDSYLCDLKRGLKVFQDNGFMLPVDKNLMACFGFIHGNWSLNNSRGKKYCGIDNEIELLKGAGCYGDFTFPALYSAAQPNLINSIYYANFKKGIDGYFKGRKATVGIFEKEDEFLIFEGPLTINWKDWRFKWHPMIENGEIGTSVSHDSPLRINSWVNQAIHVEGRPEWLFVKVFCHGGQDYQSVLSEVTDRMFTYLESAYNDGKRYQLHYVTAREAYNIVKAAENGENGNPNQFRDYLIPPPHMR